MADGAGQPRPDLTALDGHPPESFDMFELLRRLEADGRLFGHGGRPDGEPARLGQAARMSFAATDVARFRPADGREPARVEVNAVGLLGPEGPMPLHLTRWVLDRLSQRWFSDAGGGETSDRTFLEFANLAQHRLLALYYRAWADCHPAVQAERPAGGRHRALTAALAGLGLPGTGSGSAAIDAARLRHAAAFAHEARGPEHLARYFSDAFALPARVVEFVGAWIPLPRPLQTRLGGRDAGLGRGAVVGPRVFDRQGRIELRLGPLSRADYAALMPGAERFALLRSTVRAVVGGALDVDLRLVLRSADVPAARIGATRIGRDGWLARPAGAADAGDFRLRTFTGLRPQRTGAAA